MGWVRTKALTMEQPSAPSLTRWLFAGVLMAIIGSGFTGAGDVHLFGDMLNRFFALYADMNQFNQLTLIVQPEGKCIRWKENHSLRLPG